MANPKERWTEDARAWREDSLANNSIRTDGIVPEKELQADEQEDDLLLSGYITFGALHNHHDE